MSVQKARDALETSGHVLKAFKDKHVFEIENVDEKEVLRRLGARISWRSSTGSR